MFTRPSVASPDGALRGSAAVRGVPVDCRKHRVIDGRFEARGSPGGGACASGALRPCRGRSPSPTCRSLWSRRRCRGLDEHVALVEDPVDADDERKCGDRHGPDGADRGVQDDERSTGDACRPLLVSIMTPTIASCCCHDRSLPVAWARNRNAMVGWTADPSRWKENPAGTTMPSTGRPTPGSSRRLMSWAPDTRPDRHRVNRNTTTPPTGRRRCGGGDGARPGGHGRRAPDCDQQKTFELVPLLRVVHAHRRSSTRASAGRLSIEVAIRSDRSVTRTNVSMVPGICTS